MSISLPMVVPDREPLTELEARKIGDSSYRLAKLRKIQKLTGPFDLSATDYSHNGNARWGLRLTTLEAEAILALLIEREVLFLASFNVSVKHDA